MTSRTCDGEGEELADGDCDVQERVRLRHVLDSDDVRLNREDQRPEGSCNKQSSFTSDVTSRCDVIIPVQAPKRPERKA